MDRQTFYRVLADVILTVHVGVVAFVILGLVLTLLGGALRWGWVRTRWFRITHLVTIAVIVLQSWGGVICPLTTWEMDLRRAGGQKTYDETFVAHWLGQVLWFDAPPWVFVVCYTAFGLLVVAGFWFVPVRWRRNSDGSDAHGSVADQ